MPRRSPHRFSPGPLSRPDAEALSDLSRDLAGLRFVGSAPVQVDDGHHGIVISLGGQSGFWARLTGQLSPGAVYSWIAVADSTRTGTASAFEANGNAGVPTGDDGAIVWLEATAGDGGAGVDWDFCCPAPGQAPVQNYTSNTINYAGVTLNFVTTASTINYNVATTTNYSSSVNENVSNNSTFTLTVNGGSTYVFTGGGTYVYNTTNVSYTSSVVDYTSVTSTINNWALTFSSNASVWTFNVGFTWAGVGPINFDVEVVNIDASSTWTFYGPVVLCGDWSLCEEDAPAVTADMNDYPIPFHVPVLRVPINAAINLTGVARAIAGQVLRLRNIGSGVATVKHQSAASLPSNRISTPNSQDIALAPGYELDLYNDESLGCWRGEGGSHCTAKGDFSGYDGAATVRVPVGSDGQVPVADSTRSVGWKWGSAGSGAATFSGARVVQTGTVPVGDSTDTVPEFNSEAYDTDAYHDVLSASLFTIPSTGYYLIGGEADWEYNATGRRELGIVLNGTGNIATDNRLAVSDANAHTVQQVHYEGHFDAGDAVGLRLRQSSGGSLTVTAGGVKFWIEQIGGSLTAGGGSGTVTSVGLTMPDGFTVSGSPVTGSGTLAVTGGPSLASLLKWAPIL